jgi:hypothetical protein
MKSTYGFSRRTPDLLAQEIATVLSAKTWFEFKELFTAVHLKAKARNAANCGEEMLRLRTYEKLQNLVSAGVVEKISKQYRGVSSGLAAFFGAAAALEGTFTSARKPRITSPALALSA